MVLDSGMCSLLRDELKSEGTASAIFRRLAPASPEDCTHSSNTMEGILLLLMLSPVLLFLLVFCFIGKGMWNRRGIVWALKMRLINGHVVAINGRG